MSQQSIQSARRNYLRRWSATLREAVAVAVAVAAKTYDFVERERFAGFAHAARLSTTDHQWI
jgi:hypothetical protein